MTFNITHLDGAWVIDLERHEDARGFFARAWCQREFRERGLNGDLVQANISHNKHRATIRGMHYQAAPCEDVKIVRCIRGAIWDVIIDLRRESPTRGKWFGVELNAENGRQLYVPKGFAHGYQTLVDDSDVFYLHSEFYSPDAQRGVRWNDSRFAIDWPIRDGIELSDRDKAWADFQP